MSRQLTARTARIAFNQAAPTKITDVLSGGVPVIPRGNGYRIQGALFEADPSVATNLIDDLSTIASVTMVVRLGDALGTFLFEKVIALGDFDNQVMTHEQWLARASQQFTFVLSDTETNQTMPEGQTTLPIYVAFEAEIAGLPPVFLGSFTTVILEEGIGTAGTPVAGDPVYKTAAQSDAAYAFKSVSAKYRFKSDGSLQLWNATQSKWHTLSLVGASGAEQLVIATGEA